MIKSKPCKICGSIFHTAMYHKAKKPIVAKTSIKRSTKPIRKESVKAHDRRVEATEAWFAANLPDENGQWRCYISKHPNCPVYLTEETINLEHDISKTRGPAFKYDITNLFPACSFDNAAKGSLTAEEYMAL